MGFSKWLYRSCKIIIERCQSRSFFLSLIHIQMCIRDRAKINEEEDLVPALESALNMLKDVKYSKEVANDIILKNKE